MTMSGGFRTVAFMLDFSLTVLTNKLYGIIQVQEALIYFVFVCHIVNKTSNWCPLFLNNGFIFCTFVIISVI